MERISKFIGSLVDIIDTDGGNLLIYLFLILLCLHYHMDTFASMTFGALIQRLKDNVGSNKSRAVKYASPNSEVVETQTKSSSVTETK